MLLVLGSCLHSREGLASNTRTKEGLTSFLEDSLIGARGTSYPSILSPEKCWTKQSEVQEEMEPVLHPASPGPARPWGCCILGKRNKAQALVMGRAAARTAAP